MTDDRPYGRWALADDPRRLEQLFGRSDLLPLWIAEPYVELATPVRRALTERTAEGWYGYEARPPAILDAFWSWMDRRHGWAGDGVRTTVSPSVGTSIGVLIDQHTRAGDGVILQPPVFTDFKPLVVGADRRVVKNALVEVDGTYRMDHDGLAEVSADPDVRLMILCNPHNPVGRAWSESELRRAAEICAENDVLIVADEIHADLVLQPHSFTPFAVAADGTGVRWAATHGPIKTFGLAGVCDTLLISADEGIARGFQDASSRFHLTRNNVFALTAFEAGYRDGDTWLDDFLVDVSGNVEFLGEGLPSPIRLADHQATYLAWLDFRGLGLDVPDLGRWLVDAGLAVSPGHWFGREGAGFARMTIAVDRPILIEAVERLTHAVDHGSTA